MCNFYIYKFCDIYLTDCSDDFGSDDFGSDDFGSDDFGSPTDCSYILYIKYIIIFETSMVIVNKIYV